MSTILDLIRHGEPVGGRRYRGHGVDDPLSDTAWAQMWASVDAIPAPWTRIVTSPLVRCRAFAEAMGERLDLPVEIEPGIREVGFGVWEGLSPDEVKLRYADMLNAFRADPVNARPTGAEGAQAFFDRSVEALRRIAEHYDEEQVLVVAHAGTLRAATAWALQAPLAEVFRITAPYAARVRILWKQGRPFLELAPSPTLPK